MPKKELVYDITSSIPPGKVLTYGRIAQLANLHPRVVGNYLHQNHDPVAVPCHRVVNAKGELAANYAFGGREEQARKLRNEGINIIEEAKVDLAKYLWGKDR